MRRSLQHAPDDVRYENELSTEQRYSNELRGELRHLRVDRLCENLGIVEGGQG